MASKKTNICCKDNRLLDAAGFLPMETIGIVEDDALLNQALEIALKKEGYQVISARDYKEGFRLRKQCPALMVIDVNLPDGNGIDLCKAIQEYQEIPVIFLTCRDEEEDMLGAFSAGADDYVVKPFPMRVLMKRIQAVLHRCRQEKEEFLYKGLKIRFDQKKVFRDDQEIFLTPKEYRLLEYMVKNRGQLLTKNQILEQVWDVDGMFVGENTVSVTVNRLRRKIEPDASQAIYVKNVFGQGYLFGD